MSQPTLVVGRVCNGTLIPSLQESVTRPWESHSLYVPFATTIEEAVTHAQWIFFPMVLARGDPQAYFYCPTMNFAECNITARIEGQVEGVVQVLDQHSDWVRVRLLCSFNPENTCDVIICRRPQSGSYQALHQHGRLSATMPSEPYAEVLHGTPSRVIVRDRNPALSMCYMMFTLDEQWFINDHTKNTM